MSGNALETRRQLRIDLKEVGDDLRVAKNSIWDIKIALLPRARDPESTAPPTLSGLVAEALRVEGELDTLKNMYRSIENNTADIISVLEAEKEMGRGNRPWWVPMSCWDSELERDITIHSREVEKLKKKLDEAVFLWYIISHDLRLRDRS
ncbi:hypothetical protein L211DRAFT_845945 [Terfezia boudieri ATCC MYA-4762]|uniref:Uncharacterized protein n=1 Tax=Terfezia boudieri ATCC MYA-4762 TaxID=1051890 RepID=A0A3N4LYI2_9PEZI|nr:hypothetical protein L211DRAFT_845945 [Terfezia boudieri ATCC MYA-4762]